MRRNSLLMCRYCTRIYAKDPDPQGIYLLLLRLYLQPKPPDPILILPALEVIAYHSTRMDPSTVLGLLPPGVTVEDIQAFLIRTLREGHAKKVGHLVVKELRKGRKEEVDRILMGLEVKRVRITDQRM